MCGIAGLFSLDDRPADPAVLRQMCDLVRHRGPDDHGDLAAGPVGLGHRRLSIIDLSPRGRNPMGNEDGSVQLVFNGEIYNYRELREPLRAKGHVFRSESDTEVIAHLYEEKGAEVVAELNGIFAFALWDARARRLLLARDRVGTKPLYYTTVGRTLAFASEVKAFLALPEFRARPNLQALSEFLTFQNAFGDHTLFQGVHLLPAGCFLLVDAGGTRRVRYWDLQFEPDESKSEEEWAAALRTCFEDSVRRQLVSDVPVGSYLSGGMDTGSIAAVAARQIPDMHTFTCGFTIPEGASELEQHFDERAESHRLASLLGTKHHELLLGPQAMPPALPFVTWHLDEPRVGISYQVFYTAWMIRQHVKVVLSGVGGDELFGGYPWRYEPVLSVPAADFEQTYYRIWVRFFTEEEKRSFFTPEAARSLAGFSTEDSFRAELGAAEGMDPLHRALRFDFRTFLNGLLIVDDKLSMAHAVEARVPLLDNEMLELVRRMPSRLKLQPGRSKVVLKRAMHGLLPDDVLNRRKQGFTPPEETWFRTHSRAYLEETLLCRRALDRGLFEPAGVRGVLDDHFAGRRNHRFLIWFLLSFEWWNRLFVDREPLPAAPDWGASIERAR